MHPSPGFSRSVCVAFPLITLPHSTTPSHILSPPFSSHHTSPHPTLSFPFTRFEFGSLSERGLVCCCCWEGSQVERRQGTRWVVVVRRGKQLERSHESTTWFWRCGVVPGGVNVMRVAGFGARSCLGQPLSVCAWRVWCGSVGEPVSCRGLVSELAMGWFRLGGARASAAAAEAAIATAVHNKFQAAAVEVPCLVCLLSSSGLQLRGGDWLAWCC